MQLLLNQLLLGVHIAGGALCLITGFISLVIKKGGKVHRKSGKLFYYGMMAVALSALLLSIIKHIPFLLAVAVFSFYMNYFGYRALKTKTHQLQIADWTVVVLSMLAIVYMAYSMQPVLLVFGGILSVMILNTVKAHLGQDLSKPVIKQQKIQTHISLMTGAYIATITAFLVVNVKSFEPGWLLWLLPTAVGVPVIVYFSRQWKLKSAKQ